MAFSGFTQVIKPLSYTTLQSLRLDTLYATHIVFTTFSGGAWNGPVITGQYGGTGVANTSKTITLGGNLTTAGAFATILRSSAATDITLPTTGTLATLASPTFTGTVTGGDSVLVAKTVFNATTWNNAAGAASKDAVRDALILKANIAGPTFTGTISGGDSTLVTTRAFSTSTWKNSLAAPTMDAVRAQLVLKATLASPTFTGTVTGGDSVLVAKTAFNATTFNNAAGAVSKDAFRDEIILYSKIGSAETITGAKEMTGANQFYGAIITISDSTVLSKDVQYVVLANGTTHNMLLTLPAASTCSGKIIKVKCINADHAVKIITAGGTIDATVGATGFSLAVWDGREFMSNGTNWYIISKF